MPAPSLVDPFAVGEALYDPSRVDVGVVSLLALMGVGIYAPDGTPVREGAEHEAGDPWLFDVEVRDLIDRSAAELADSLEQEDGALPFAMDDLYADVAPFIPDLDARAFTRAYADAYAERPDDLVPQVLLGQPIDGSFRMTSVHAWLLFVDGFVGPADERFAGIVPGAGIAAAALGPPWGTAQPNLPATGIRPGVLTYDEGTELMVHIRTLASLIGFDVTQGEVHEGHGGPGDPGTIGAWLGPSVPLVSPTTGRHLLEQVNGDRGDPLGLEIRWETSDPSSLQKHGSLDRSLPAVTPASAAGDARVVYNPRREPADGVGFEAEDFASLYASVDKWQLIEAFYESSDPWVQQHVLGSGMVRGRRVSSTRGFAIGFHGPGINLSLTDVYDVTVGIGIGMDAQAHRNGTDSAEGLLTKYPDGTYRGLMRGVIASTTDMTLTLPLVAGECHAPTTTTQQLWVVGRVVPGGALIRDQDTLVAGTPGTEDLILSFYPLEPADGIGACDAPIPYTGRRLVDGKTIVGPYAPFNDSRWSSPDVGYRIHLPEVGGLIYEDWSQVVPAAGVDSQWTVDVDRSE